MTSLHPDIIRQLAARARDAGVFGAVHASDQALECAVAAPGVNAAYRVGEDESGRILVSFVTPDRWLSESIEADLQHTGDDLSELLEEELAEFNIESRPDFEHFRDEDRLFTFQIVVAAAAVQASDAPCSRKREDSDTVLAYLLACEACFRELGHVSGDNDAL